MTAAEATTGPTRPSVDASLVEPRKPALREYEDFANLTFQLPALNRLLDLVGISPEQDMVDLGCGTGMVTRALLDRRGAGASGRIYAVDPEPAMLEKASKSLEQSAAAAVSWVVGRAEDLDRLVPPVDRVLFCNAIHLVEEKANGLQAIFESLKPTGRLAFNSAYTKDHRPPESESFYVAWMRQALRSLRQDHPDVQRDPSAPRPLAGTDLMSRDEYLDLARQTGFRVVADEVAQVDMPLESWVDISAYSRFVRSVLPGVPLEWAAEALQEGARRTFRRLGLTSVPRNWFQVVLERP